MEILFFIYFLGCGCIAILIPAIIEYIIPNEKLFIRRIMDGWTEHTYNIFIVLHFILSLILALLISTLWPIYTIKWLFGKRG